MDWKSTLLFYAKPFRDFLFRILNVFFHSKKIPRKLLSSLKVRNVGMNTTADKQKIATLVINSTLKMRSKWNWLDIFDLMRPSVFNLDIKRKLIKQKKITFKEKKNQLLFRFNKRIQWIIQRARVQNLTTIFSEILIIFFLFRIYMRKKTYKDQ